MKRDRSGDVIGGQLVHRHAYSPAGGCVSLPRLVAEREPKRAGDGGTAGEWATPNRMPIQQRPTNAQGRERRDSWPELGPRPKPTASRPRAGSENLNRVAERKVRSSLA